MSDNNASTGNSHFNDIPSWYADTAVPPAPSDQLGHGAPPAPANGAATTSYSAAPTSSTAGRAAKGFGFSMIARVGIGALLLGGGWLFTRGTTSADALEVGDCFVMDDSAEIDRVDTPDCSEAHDSQVVGLVDIANAGPYPDVLDPYWEQVFSACDTAALTILVNIEGLPADANLEMLTPLEAGWDAGDRGSICVLHAPSGLAGSFVRAS